MKKKKKSFTSQETKRYANRVQNLEVYFGIEVFQSSVTFLTYVVVNSCKEGVVKIVAFNNCGVLRNVEKAQQAIAR